MTASAWAVWAYLLLFAIWTYQAITPYLQAFANHLSKGNKKMSFPISAVTSLISIYKSGQYVANGATIMSDLYQLLQYAWPQATAQKAASSGQPQALRPQSADEVVSALESLATSSGQPQALPINWLSVAEFVAKMLLEAFASAA